MTVSSPSVSASASGMIVSDTTGTFGPKVTEAAGLTKSLPGVAVPETRSAITSGLLMSPSLRAIMNVAAFGPFSLAAGSMA